MFDNGLLVKDGGFALDVGCGNGRDSQFLIENGYMVTSLDKETSFPGAVVTDIRDFIIEPEKYSFITANNVLPFLSSQDEVYKRLILMIGGLKKGGILHFTLFGKNSDIKVPIHFTYSEMEDFVDVFMEIKVQEKSTREGHGKSMKGLPIWSHVHTFVLQKI